MNKRININEKKQFQEHFKGKKINQKSTVGILKLILEPKSRG